MQRTDLSQQERDSRLMNEFDKFFDEAGESLESIYERFSRLMNNMEQNKVLPNKITINTKLLNSLQPKWINYVMMVRQSQQLQDVKYDPLYDYLSQNEANVNASRAKRVAGNHDPLALVANTYVSPSYSRSSQSYYVIHLPSVHDFYDDYQGENVGYAGNGRRNSRRIVGNQGNSVGNDFVQKNIRNVDNVQRNPRTTTNYGKTPQIQRYNCNEKGHYARECSKPKLEELNASVIMMACIQPADNDSDAEPTYDSDFVSKVNDSQIELINGLFSNRDPEQQNHEKLETIKPTSIDDQINCNIISDDPYVEVNGGQVEHTYDAHDQKLDSFEYMIRNVQIEAKNQRMVNKEMKRKNVLITKELKTYKERVQVPFLAARNGLLFRCDIQSA
ncbi:integrase, catalytic region, zinc finger, CCHC-type containing protein [Tanacetum coccineum]